MNRAVVTGLLVLTTLAGGSACSSDTEKPNVDHTTIPAATCTAATATEAARSKISKSTIAPACVKVSKGGSFTLLNADSKAHSFTTTQGAPVPLQVDLKEGAAFPYRFKKVGTYTLKEAKSDLVLTIIVG
jgi:plastocyanin